MAKHVKVKKTKKIDTDLLKEFCLGGTIVGLKYFYIYPDRVSRYGDQRCFWAATLVALVACACEVSWLLYERFDQMPTRQTIENQYEPLASLPYPAITICSPTQITISSMEHFSKTLVNGNTTIDLETVLPQLLGYYEIIADINLDQLSHLQDLIRQNRYTVPQVMGLLPQSCDNFLKLCVFKMETYKCRDMFRPLLTRHGLCCTFNSAYHFNYIKNEKSSNYTPHMASMRGIVDALRLVVDYEPDDAVAGSIFLAGAIRVMVSDWSELPSDEESVLVYPNTESFNVIRGTYTYCSEEVAQLPPWSRQCLFGHERNLQYFQQYRNSDCDHLCRVRAVERRCGCLPLFVPYIHHGNACNFTNIPCIIQVKATANRDLGNVDCDCPRDCESRRYTLDMSVGNLLGLEHITINPYVNITFHKSTSIMTFFFPSSVYVKKKQETVMSLINLASNLGGIFGMCLGCSVISVLEILFYAYRATRRCIARPPAQDCPAPTPTITDPCRAYCLNVTINDRQP